MVYFVIHNLSFVRVLQSEKIIFGKTDIYQRVKLTYRNISLCINVELPVDISLLHEPQLVLIRCAYLIC